LERPILTLQYDKTVQRHQHPHRRVTLYSATCPSPATNITLQLDTTYNKFWKPIYILYWHPLPYFCQWQTHIHLCIIFTYS